MKQKLILETNACFYRLQTNYLFNIKNVKLELVHNVYKRVSLGYRNIKYKKYLNDFVSTVSFQFC